VSEVSVRYGAIADGFTARVAGVGADGWSALTPCSDWTVRELVAHVITTHRRVMATLEETEPVEADADGDFLLAQWLDASGAVVESLGDEARASKVVGGMFGEQTWESLVGRLVCSDTLVHTWDLARATGQDESLDPGAVPKALEALTPLDEALRRPGGFGAKIEAPSRADAQTAFLNFCGRAV
jgi:uncharacterized protein (TIGR03086 family)